MDGGGGVTSCRSILDKPLSQLTEEDISQLTREDCRKFLKEKGMRRPSWNKSQAIQQVISLKALLETTDDSGTAPLRKVFVSPPENLRRVNSNSADSFKEPSLVLGDENRGYRRKDPPKCAAADTDTKPISNRNPGEPNGSIEQMTIFYCGKVNVYDGVPPDKAQTIMHLAATPVDFPQDGPCSGVASFRSLPCHLQAASDRHCLAPPPMISQTMQTEKIPEYAQEYRERGSVLRDSEGQANRKVSLQRYLEKRKDRGRIFKCKKNTVPTSSTLEMYLNNQAKTRTSNGQPSDSNTSSPTQPGLSHVLCSSVDNQAKIASLSVDLNNEDSPKVLLLNIV